MKISINNINRVTKTTVTKVDYKKYYLICKSKLDKKKNNHT